MNRIFKKEMNMSNNNENSKSNDQQPVIEDLAVKEDEVPEVKGGTGWGSSMYQYAFDTPHRQY